MEISARTKKSARRLLAETPVADLHMDLPGELLFRHRGGRHGIIAEKYLPLWQQTGIALVGAAVYLEDDCLPEGALRGALLQIEALREEIRETKGAVHLIRCRDDLDRAYRKDSVGILLYMEGLECLGTDVGLLSLLSELGVTGASLVWSRQNLLACGCCRAGELRPVGGGLTEAGVHAIHKMKELRMFLDVSHLNDDGIKEVLRMSDIPMLATHSNARSVCFHYRNLTDSQIALLAGRGGLIGLNGCSRLTGSCRDGRHLEMLLRHGMYLLQRAGADHVALGLDLCHAYELARQGLDDGRGQGEDALADQGEVALLAAAFLEAGMEPETVGKVLGENVFAFLYRALP